MKFPDFTKLPPSHTHNVETVANFLERIADRDFTLPEGATRDDRKLVKAGWFPEEMMRKLMHPAYHLGHTTPARDISPVLIDAGLRPDYHPHWGTTPMWTRIPMHSMGSRGKRRAHAKEICENLQAGAERQARENTARLLYEDDRKQHPNDIAGFPRQPWHELPKHVQGWFTNLIPKANPQENDTMKFPDFKRLHPSHYSHVRFVRDFVRHASDEAWYGPEAAPDGTRELARSGWFLGELMQQVLPDAYLPKSGDSDERPYDMAQVLIDAGMIPARLPDHGAPMWVKGGVSPNASKEGRRAYAKSAYEALESLPEDTEIRMRPQGGGVTVGAPITTDKVNPGTDPQPLGSGLLGGEANTGAPEPDARPAGGIYDFKSYKMGFGLTADGADLLMSGIQTPSPLTLGDYDAVRRAISYITDGVITGVPMEIIVGALDGLLMLELGEPDTNDSPDYDLDESTEEDW